MALDPRLYDLCPCMPTDLPSPVTAFDSSTVPLDALAHFLRGEDYQVLGMSTPMAKAVSSASAPDMALHHMVDPSQDRLMSREALYFRLKRLRLGHAYASFITRHLAPGGTLFTVECDLSWPVKRVADRHVFQFGGVGGLSPD